MAISVYASSIVRIGTATTAWSIATPAGSANKLAIVACYTRNDHTVSTPPSGYQALFKAQWDPGDPQITYFALALGASPPANIALTMASAVYGDMAVIVLDGASLTNSIVDVAEADYSSGLAPNAPVPALTTTIAQALVMAVLVSHQVNNLFTKPSGWGTVAQLGTASQPGAIMAVKGIQAAAATQAAENFTYSGTAAYGSAARFSVRPASAANVAPTVNPGTTQNNIKPGQTVTITGSAADSDGTVASTSWTQVSGPAVTLSGTGDTRTFEAPAVENGATIVMRYSATDNSGATTTGDVTINVLPCTYFVATASGWVGVNLKQL